MTITCTLFAEPWRSRVCSLVCWERFWQNFWRRLSVGCPLSPCLSRTTCTNQGSILGVRGRSLLPTLTTWRWPSVGIRRQWHSLGCPVVEWRRLRDWLHPMSVLVWFLSNCVKGNDVTVGVMKEKELKLEEIEASHPLGGSGEGRVTNWRGEGNGEGVHATLLQTDTQESYSMTTQLCCQLSKV